MGFYTGVYENKCPRCNEGDVTTVFISVTPMSYSEGCNSCGANDFNEDEHRALGDKLGTYYNAETGIMERFNYPSWKAKQVDDQTDPAYD